MKKNFMKWLTAGVFCLGSVLSSQAQVAGDPAGYNTINVPADSDVIFSVPFEGTVVESETVSGAPAGNTLNVAGTPFAGDAYANTFYVRFTSGARAGSFSTVTANTDSSVTIQDASGVAGGDTFNIVEHATLASTFPVTLEGFSFLSSTSLFGGRKTEILQFDNAGALINRSASAIYFFGPDTATGTWKNVNNVFGNANDTVLAPGSFFILRNQDSTGTPPALTLVTVGSVDLENFALTIRKEASPNDVLVSNNRPIDLSLNELGLGGTAAFTSSTGQFGGREDELIVFDNTTSGINKSGARIFFYFAGEWYDVNNVFLPVSNDPGIIEAGSAFIIRRSAGTPSSDVWSNIPTY